ncbi:glycoside hydrolase family 43 protein [Mucilaginibacter aquatilis]|uniref:Family 43 glycosylhydrolase n=1 Tax=Mucilaginibacter aquatilis TaxID=1517760 RepID=A0A6I4I8L5_9SPHI|nr:glycoside hydrolase family 43 protein [Mucilaginibacter aquatilis]MVN91247.1 family 43 glycosylhydrolase [Mucilaginibacter aquatilis]
MKRLIFSIILIYTSLCALAQGDSITLADPTIFKDADTYYLYGTGKANGFGVYTSTDLKSWKLNELNALTKGESFGTSGFWAPQVFKHQNKYYMAYTANEQIAIAEASSAMGPFKQQQLKHITLSGKHIDPFVFKDTNGDFYLYFVRLTNGNRIYMARLNNNLTDIDSTTLKPCIAATEIWENTANSNWPVTEGPTVVKIKNRYYMFYSANDFRNIDYAVGYATAPSPLGPWKKYKGNPLISRRITNQNGSGHGDIFKGNDDKWYYVFHAHNTNSKVGPRKTALIKLKLTVDGNFETVPSSLRYLKNQ